MNKISIQYFQSPYGELIIGSLGDELCLCDWRYRKMRESIDKRITRGLEAEYVIEKSFVIEQTIEQLEVYFAQKRTSFDIPLKLVGTDFQQLVWKELLKIPYGKTESYLGLSKKLNNPNAIRVVASANGANAISIIVPCHRIIGSKGELVGYAGGLSAKKRLLQLERIADLPEQLSLF